MIFYKQRYLHSTLVPLIPSPVENIWNSVSYLHSTLVPLILCVFTPAKLYFLVFTFYFSSFNSDDNYTHETDVLKFTFYFSSFNSHVNAVKLFVRNLFTFYFSSFNSSVKIVLFVQKKTFTFYFSSFNSVIQNIGRCQAIINLHSTLVPLILWVMDIDVMQKADLHSTLVPLILLQTLILLRLSLSFTFYFSSFNSEKYRIKMCKEIKFTFYFSSFNSGRWYKDCKNYKEIYILL